MADFAPPAVRKRARSPSPPTPGDLHSPIDVLMKRRRKAQPHAGRCASWNGPSVPFRSQGAGSRAGPEELVCPFTHLSGSGEAGPSAFAQPDRAELEHMDMQPGIERRRAKQWERLNAPLPSFSSSVAGHRSGEAQRAARTQVHSSPYGLSTESPVPQWPFMSQPTPSRLIMSSSPIRHLPPGSSPFKDGNGVELDPWDVEEMRREWGEYGEQNEILHSVHLSRSYTTVHGTPDQTLLQTPAHLTRSQLTASSSVSRLPPSSLPQASPGQAASWRMNYFPSSSPVAQYSSLPVFSPLAASERGDAEADDERMEVLDDGPDRDLDKRRMEREVLRRYEETNRLLGELAVVRRQRWGGPEDESADA